MKPRPEKRGFRLDDASFRASFIRFQGDTVHLSTLEIILITSTLLEFNPLFQAGKSLRSKSVKDVSIWTFLCILALGSLWLYYGLTLMSWPLIFGNAIKIFASLSVVVIWAMYRNRNPAP